MYNYISEEKIYYRIADQYISILKNNNIMIYKDHGNYYCSISMRQLYELFSNSSKIKVKYRCKKCGNINILDCQNITKKLKKNNYLYCPKCTKGIKVFKFVNNALISKQQQYFYNLFMDAAELNYYYKPFFIDIAFPQLKIGIEYNGSGHNLDVKLKGISNSQFIAKEWARRKILQNNQWKMIYIIAERDKINLYTNDEYIQIFNYAYNLLLQENIVEIYLEDNRILTRTKLIYISDIINKKIRNMQIYSIKQAIKYLHISSKTLYHLHQKRLLLMNMTLYNFRYYLKNQLDEYIQKFGKLNNNYLLFYEIAQYLNISLIKVQALIHYYKVYPSVINNEKYYLKSEIDKYINKQQLINILSRKEASKYLHMSLATLDRKKMDKTLIPIIDNLYYSKEQLDQYLQDNDRNINFNDYISCANALKQYSISRNKIKQLIDAAKIDVRWINNQYFLLKADIERYVIEHNVNTDKYLMRGDILKKYNITESQWRYLLNKYNIIPTKINHNNYYDIDKIDKFINEFKLHISIQNNPDYLTTANAAKYLNVSLPTFYKLRKADILLPDTSTYYSKDKLDNWNNNFNNSFILVNIVNQFVNNIPANINVYVIRRFSYYYISDIFPYCQLTSIHDLCNQWNIDYKSLVQWCKEYNIIIIQDYIFIKQLNQLRARLMKQCITYINQLKAIYNNQIGESLKNVVKFTVTEAAKKLSLNKSIIDYAIHTSKIKCITFNNIRYITLQQLNEYQEKYLNIDNYLSFLKAVKYLNISNNTLEIAIRQNKITPIFINNKRYFSLNDLNMIKNLWNKNEDLFTTQQAAKYLHLSRNTVRQYSKQGKIKFIRGIQDKFFYNKADLDEYLLSQKQEQNTLEQLYNLNQTCEYLHTSRSSLQRWKVSGKLVPMIINHIPYYTKVQLDKFHNN